MTRLRVNGDVRRLQETMTITLKAKPSNAEIMAFAEQWTELLCREDYSEAFSQLLYRPEYPGKSWCHSAEDLRAWIAGYGTNVARSDEPVHRVTSPTSAAGRPGTHEIYRGSKLYPDYVASLDYWLPLDGEWSDLMASFDFVKIMGGVSPVLRALRIP
jgi:hypothetical protein